MQICISFYILQCFLAVLRNRVSSFTKYYIALTIYIDFTVQTAKHLQRRTYMEKDKMLEVKLSKWKMKPPGEIRGNTSSRPEKKSNKFLKLLLEVNTVREFHWIIRSVISENQYILRKSYLFSFDRLD